jgi:threonylcarbamoyladenosine tRNA methylthiotransferase MtaB
MRYLEEDGSAPAAENQSMSKFKITTLGCKVNQAESEAIAQKLLSSKWLVAGDLEKADTCIVNTCSITQKAAMQSRQAVRRAIRANPNANIIVTGCYAQTAPQEIETIEGVNYIVGHGEKHNIGHMICTAGIRARSHTIAIGADLRKKRPFASMPLADAVPRTRPFLKIQDGCDAFCTYCIVPYARGRSRSMPLEDVLANIGKLAEAGYREVVLTGIHLGVYGHDLSPKTNLATALGRISELWPIDRVRLSSIEPFEVTEQIIHQVLKSDIFCRHFHIPLQSGDPGILENMGRPYSPRFFGDLINKIHQTMPEAAIGVDTLIGFPGESESAFENTYNLIDKLPISYLHVFPFSARPGTKAADLPDKVDVGTIKERCERMRILGNNKRKKFFQGFIGQALPILVETNREASTKFLKGMSSNYLPVLIDAGDNLKNKIVNVTIEKHIGHQLFGALQRA